MTFTGETIQQLRHLTDTVCDLAKEKEPWEIVTNAIQHLSNGHRDSRYPGMDQDDEEAWRILHFIQADLTWKKHCGMEYSRGTWDATGEQCHGEIFTFCGDCGLELCRKCCHKCCMETYCPNCLDDHSRKQHGPEN